MKFLIYNYSTPWFTEPLYFHAGINLLKDKCKAIFYDNNKSVYDNFDIIEPDHFIINYGSINDEFVNYLENNKSIKVLINVSNVNQNIIKSLEDSLTKLKISYLLFGSNEDISSNKFLKILECADIFIPTMPKEYDIQKLIFVSKEDQITDLDGTYHYVSDNKDLHSKIDFIVGIKDFVRLFSNYKEIIFKDPSYVGSQISFNAIYSGVKVVFDFKDTEALDKIDSIFKGHKLLASTKNHHTCLHRLKTLLCNLNSSLSQDIEKLLGEI